MDTRRTIDITFQRTGSNPVMYRLWSDPREGYVHNLVANVSDQPPYASWSIGKDDWNDDPIIEKADSGRLYHAMLSHYPAPGERLAAPIQAAVKWMRGKKEIEALRHEADMYAGPLRALQGSVVPMFHGFYSGNIEGVEIGCIVLEWCPENDWTTFGKPKQDERSVRFLRMEAVRQLHLAGVKHGQLYDRRDRLRALDGRHFLRAQDGSMRIVGFQRAKPHKCNGGMHEHDSLQACLDEKCRELCYAEVHWRRAIEGGLDDVRWLPY